MPISLHRKLIDIIQTVKKAIDKFAIQAGKSAEVIGGGGVAIVARMEQAEVNFPGGRAGIPAGGGRMVDVVVVERADVGMDQLVEMIQ